MFKPICVCHDCGNTSFSGMERSDLLIATAKLQLFQGQESISGIAAAAIKNVVWHCLSMKKVVWQMPYQPYRLCRPWLMIIIIIIISCDLILLAITHELSDNTCTVTVAITTVIAICIEPPPPPPKYLVVLYSRASEQRTLWEQASCPLLGGCPYLGGS